jgi:hypothetical protein
MLSNDRHSEWSKDAELGRKIGYAMNDRSGGNLGYGRVVQCVHADTQTLAVLDMYDGFTVLANGCWQHGQKDDEVALKLLKEAADKLGYSLRKKPVKE